MGSSSKSSSQSSSSEVTDSNNTTLTNSITGQGGFGINTGNIGGAISGLSYAYDSNNPMENNNNTYALGANSSASPSNSLSSTPPVGSSGIDWSEVIVYVIAGVVLVYVLRLLGDNNA